MSSSESEAQAQHLARAEVQSMLDSMTGENAPIDVVICFRCPDGQFGYFRTANYALVQVGMLEAAKAALLTQMSAPRVTPDAAGTH